MRIQTVVEQENLTVSVHKRIMRQVMEDTGRRHINRRVGKHFQRNRETSPGGPYGFVARTRKTRKAKRAYGVDPHRPNYKTGNMLREVQANSKLTRTRFQWSWTARSPFKLRLQRRQELEAISREEIADDTKFMARRYVHYARLPSNRPKRRRRAG